MIGKPPLSKLALLLACVLVVSSAKKVVDTFEDDSLESTDYPVTNGRGPWDKIIAIGDIHGDLDQAMTLLKQTGAISHQPDFYTNLILANARKASSSAYGDGSVVTAESGSSKKKKGKGNAVPVIKTVDQKKEEDGLGQFLPKDIAANMVYNKRGYVMGGSTADEYHWAVGKTLLVILGDCMNIGPDDIAAVTLVRRLTREADMAGGKVVYVLGNHEVMNLRGDFSGVHPWSFERTGGLAGRRRLLSTATPLGHFLRSRPGLFFYDNLMFMHAGLVPGAIKAVERATGHDSMTGKQLADTINKHVRSALIDNEDDPDAMDSDPVAATVVNVNYDENGKNGILLVHPLEDCERVQRANKMIELEAQVVGHTPHDLPTYDYCHGSLYGIDFKTSKWKGGAQAIPAALILLREEVPVTSAAAAYDVGGGTAAPPSTVAADSDNNDEEKLNEEKKRPTFRWTTRLVVPQKAVVATQSRLGGWTSISFLGFVVWVLIVVVALEVLRLAYKFIRNRGMAPTPLNSAADKVSTFCDVLAGYLPCSLKKMAHRKSRGGMYRPIDGDESEDLRPTKSAPF